MKTTKSILFACAALSLAAALLSQTACGSFSEMKDFAANAVITTPDLTALEDGDYEGSYASGIVSATVRLTMSDHRIVDFTILKHKTGKGKPAEALAATVVEKQSLSVDAVSGATISSKVILKAAESALGQGNL